jgi:nucleotide-binding universal stress UspA family protein
MFESIIVPFDGTDIARRAVRPAAQMARACDTDLRLVTFTEDPTTARELYSQIDFELAKVDVGSRVATVYTSASGIGPQVAKLASRHRDSLMCMGSVGRSHLGALTGSVVEFVLHAATGPMLLVGPSCDPSRFSADGLIGLAHDNDDGSAVMKEIVGSWAHILGNEIEVLTVHDPEAPAAIQRARAHGEDVALESSDGQRVAAQLQHRLGRPVGHATLHSHDAAEALIDHTSRYGHAMAAMATRARTGVERLVMGSTTMAVVHGASCPVLVHHPSDEPTED